MSTANKIFCKKFKEERDALEKQPTMGEVGKLAKEHLSKDGWKLWLTIQMIIINENQLNLNSEENLKNLKEMFMTFLKDDSLEKEYLSKIKNQKV